MGTDDGDVAAAAAGDEAAFARVVGRYRTELFAHSYRMLASAPDAEEALQDALLDAWRGLPGFAGRSSVRTWLYRITTNACLRSVRRRPTRRLSPDLGPARESTDELGPPMPGPVWVEPLLEETPGTDPAARYLRREGVELAFVAALQHLPGTQRAALIMRDVLAFSAEETAAVLDTTTASVTSALQRARRTVADRVDRTDQGAELARLGDAGQRELVDAFVSAWERSDVNGLLELLTADARFTMPPLPAWFEGRGSIGRFVSERMFVTAWRLVPTRANGQLAFYCYQSGTDGTFRLGAVNVLSLREGRICWIAGFVDPARLSTYGVPEILEEFPGDR